jgi:hypothetical protein
MTSPASLIAQLAAQGPPGPVGASVANTAALAALATTTFIPGTLAYVQSLKSLFYLDPTSTATPDNVTIIAAQGGGNWLSLSSGPNSRVVNVNTNGSAGRTASPYTAKAGDVVVVSLNVGAVVVNLPVLAIGQEVTVVIDDGTPPSAGSGLTINAAATTTLAQPTPNNGQASVTTLSFTNAAYAGGSLTWSNCGTSDGRYLLV